MMLFLMILSNCEFHTTITLMFRRYSHTYIFKKIEHLSCYISCHLSWKRGYTCIAKLYHLLEGNNACVFFDVFIYCSFQP